MKVLEVNKGGLSFVDDSGETKFVDLIQCNEHWIQHRKRTEKLNEEMVLKIRETDTCVGHRDVTATPCFFQFFTRPFTKVELHKDEFTELKQKLSDLGWNTLDLS